MTIHDVSVHVASDDQAATNVQFARVNVIDIYGTVVGDATTDESGSVVFALDAGTYSFRGSKPGWRINELTLDVLNATDSVELPARKLVSAWLMVVDLENAVGVDTVDQLFYDPATGKRSSGKLQRMMQLAEAHTESILMRAWTRDNVKSLALEDECMRMHAAWIALEFAAESKTEFLAADGSGRFAMQFARATKYFNDLSKNNLESRAAQAPKGAPAQSGQAGGMRRPKVLTTGGAFIFADEDGQTHGGF